MQINLARFVCESHYNTNVAKLLHELNLLPVRQRITYEVATIAYLMQDCRQNAALTLTICYCDFLLDWRLVTTLIIIIKRGPQTGA